MLQTLLVALLSLKVGFSVGASSRSWTWLAPPLVLGACFAALEPGEALSAARAASLGLGWGFALSLLHVGRWSLRLRPGVSAVVASLALEAGALSALGLRHFAPDAPATGALAVLAAGLSCAVAGGVGAATGPAARQSARLRLATAACALGVGACWVAEARRLAPADAVEVGAVAGWALLLLAVTAAPPLLASGATYWVRRYGPALSVGAALALPATALALGSSVKAPDTRERPSACAAKPEVIVTPELDLRELAEPLSLVQLQRSWGAPTGGVSLCLNAHAEARPQPYRVGLFLDDAGQVVYSKAVPQWQLGPAERELAACLERVFDAIRVPGAACHQLDGLVVTFHASPRGPEEPPAR